MTFALVFASMASATTFLPPPPVNEQLAASVAAGEYVVLSTTVVTLEDGFVVTDAEVEATGTLAHGTVVRATVRFPGGVVDGRFKECAEGAPQVSTGDVLFLVLSARQERLLVANGWPSGMFRKVDSPSGPVMVDTAGRFVSAVPCNGRPLGVAQAPPVPENPDLDETGRLPLPAPNTRLVLDPLAAALTWDSAVAAFATCGGGR